MRKATDIITACLWATHPTLDASLVCTYDGDAPLSRGLCANHSQKVKKFIDAPLLDNNRNVLNDMVPSVPVTDSYGCNVLNKGGQPRFTYTEAQEDIRIERKAKMVSKGLLGAPSSHVGRGDTMDYSDIDSILV
jgi:hypothetical protein